MRAVPAVIGWAGEPGLGHPHHLRRRGARRGRDVARPSARPAGSVFKDGDRAAGVFGVLATGFALLLGSSCSWPSPATTSPAAAPRPRPCWWPSSSRRRSSCRPRCARASADRSSATAAPSCTRSGRRWRPARRSTASTRGASRCSTPWRPSTRRPRPSRRPTASGSTRPPIGSPLATTASTAPGVIPDPLWLVLFATAAVIFVFMLFFADSGERAVVQGVLMGTIVVVITMTLLLINFLDSPFRSGFGGLRPVAMERTLSILDQERQFAGDRSPLPCDADGAPHPLRAPVVGRSRKIATTWAPRCCVCGAFNAAIPTGHWLRVHRSRRSRWWSTRTCGGRG